MTRPCPCGTGSELSSCCEPYIGGELKPDTPEALMRSRYTAYELAETSYITQTHHHRTRHEIDEKATQEWAERCDWLELKILDAPPPEGDKGQVEFMARYDDPKGVVRNHHEISQFERVDGAWYFVAGDLVQPNSVERSGPKVGRNDPCPCGSGKKSKKCCGRPGVRTD